MRLFAHCTAVGEKPEPWSSLDADLKVRSTGYTYPETALSPNCPPALGQSVFVIYSIWGENTPFLRLNTRNRCCAAESRALAILSLCL